MENLCIDKTKLFENLKKDFQIVVEQYRKCKSEDYVKIEFWEQIMRSKIEVIAAIGGFSFMQEFCDYLSENDTKLNLYSAFDYYADGIGGWCR